MASGRPSKFTPSTKNRLIKAISMGMYYNSACCYANIKYRTFRYWMLKGEKAKNQDYLHFFHAIKKAELEAKVRVILLWQKAIPNDWKAAATFLERRYPSRWGRKNHFKVSGKDNNSSLEINTNALRNKIISRKDWKNVSN